MTEEEKPIKIHTDLDIYANALLHVQSIYERLYFKEKLTEACKECPLLLEVSKLLEMVNGERILEIEKALGYREG